ncbi:hypothetical protein AQJ66_07655 [Streptomyces bungoensis]|uniref:DUF397 domain-containing protein n=1 Tax=Streptomyces bungoensis TaxID=285568 RepID=A0A101T9Q8_9ACTN|nr:DUF397 domain-containing protein [Streptomyces bungoensis]KUN88223.1 hypothetical protein AQJ66_07655 [Streptomyces bungoensis]
MRAIDLSDADWRKSSYSNSDGGNCLEVADDIPSVVPVRDSKAPARGALVFRAGAWAAFVDGLRRAGAE